ncbi:hypothetical protein CDL15_Pgr005787 [Punica granatum]|nr:hypothetical protein CDL15_Pgr005787 [Punica granatum]
MIERLNHFRDQLQVKKNTKLNDLDYVESARDALMKFAAPNDDITTMIERLNQVRDQLQLNYYGLMLLHNFASARSQVKVLNTAIRAVESAHDDLMKYVAPDDDITTMIERLNHFRNQLHLKKNMKLSDLDYVESARDALMKYAAPDDDITTIIERLNQVRDQLQLKWNTAHNDLDWALNIINKETYIYYNNK